MRSSIAEMILEGCSVEEKDELYWREVYIRLEEESMHMTNQGIESKGLEEIKQLAGEILQGKEMDVRCLGMKRILKQLE